MAESVYTITPRPPIRALVIAAVTSLVGAVLLVVALASSWHVAVAVVGGLLLAGGLALAVAALLTPSRLAVTVTLDDDGYRVTGSGGEQVGAWDDVTRVTQSDDGAHVTIHHGEDRRNHLIFAGQDPAVIAKVLLDVQRRLSE